MLEKPDVPDERVIGCLQREYGLAVSGITFLPLGADVDTAVYRVDCLDGNAYFVKLRGGTFDEVTVLVPYMLRVGLGIHQIIPPLPRLTGELWSRLDDYAVIVFPFVDGENGFDRQMSDQNWIELGQTLVGLHAASLPDDVLRRLPRETFSSHWRDRVVMFQSLVETVGFTNAEAVQAAAIVQANRNELTDLIARASRLADRVGECTLEFVPCHADIHAGNVLIDNSGRLHVVDWDTLILAPKERDLMFIGAGIGGVWTSNEESVLFQQGYGPAQVDADAIAYYRCERILADIAEYCDQLLLTEDGGEDREQSLGYFASNFGSDGLIEFTLSLDRD